MPAEKAPANPDIDDDDDDDDEEHDLTACGDCDAPAEWLRCTQFAGDHPFCEHHARVERGRGVTNEFWKRADGKPGAWEESEKKPGYHLADIEKGVLGEVSKIAEEVKELQDAADQGCKIMELVELSDLYGAIQKYLIRHHPGMTMTDLKTMSKITARAFTNGHR